MKIGYFHDVVAVDGNRDTISILSANGLEKIIALEADIDLKVNGAFGDLSTSRGGDILPGIFLEGVSKIEVYEDEFFEDPDHEIELKHLTVQTAQGPFEWDLICRMAS